MLYMAHNVDNNYNPLYIAEIVNKDAAGLLDYVQELLLATLPTLQETALHLSVYHGNNNDNTKCNLRLGFSILESRLKLAQLILEEVKRRELEVIDV